MTFLPCREKLKAGVFPDFSIAASARPANSFLIAHVIGQSPGQTSKNFDSAR